MKIVSWNINGRDKTLDFVLKNSLNADLYLLQEVKASNNLNEKYKVELNQRTIERVKNSF